MGLLLNGPQIHEQHFSFLPGGWEIYFSSSLFLSVFCVFILLSHTLIYKLKRPVCVCACMLACMCVTITISHCDKVVWQAVSHSGHVVDGSSPTHDKACQSPQVTLRSICHLMCGLLTHKQIKAEDRNTHTLEPALTPLHPNLFFSACSSNYTWRLKKTVSPNMHSWHFPSNRSFCSLLTLTNMIILTLQ